LIQRAPQRDRDRLDDCLARAVVGTRQHGGDHADEREQDHGLRLAAQQRLELAVQVVDHVQDEVGVRLRFHVFTLSRAIPAIRPQLTPVW